MPLTLQVTAAGRAAQVNAQNTGTLPVLVAKIGVTAQAFTAAPDGSDLVLPGELKQLSTFAGSVVADDTIHVTIRDDSADQYSMRGFALYLDDGTLFALYGQADPILEKSVQAMLLLATDVIFADIAATSLTFGDASFINPPATTEQVGVVELATDAEAAAGVDGTRAVPPSALKAAMDGRLGAGAPSAFFKGLMTSASAAVLRTALAIKAAALKDEGAGNGLDADLLDGQHGSYYRAWANLTGVPATFTPSAHAHLWADITNPPATFPPSAHAHAIGDVTGLQAALDGKVATGNLALAADLNMNNAPVGNWLAYMGTQNSADGNNWPLIGADGQPRYWNVLTYGNSGRTVQLAIHAYNTDSLKTHAFIRYKHDSVWYPWAELWHSGNFNPATKLDATANAVSASKLATARAFSLTGVVTAAAVNFDGTGNAALNTAIADGALSIAKTAGLQAALDAKAALSGATFTGPIAVTGAFTGAQRSLVLTNTDTAGTSTYSIQIKCGTGAGATFSSPAPTYTGVAGFADAGVIENAGANGIVMSMYGGGSFRWLAGASRTQVASLDGSGNLTLAGAVVATGGFQVGSSERLKTDLELLPYGLDAVDAIAVRRGRYIPEFNADGRRRLFVLAEQLATVVPEAVFEDGVEHDGERFASVEYTQLVPVLIAAVQELSARLRALEECAAQGGA